MNLPPASPPAARAPATIAIVTGAPLCRNPRVVKEATALGEAGYRVTVLRPVLRADWHARDREIEATAPWRTVTTADLTAGSARRLGLRFARRIGMAAVQHARWPAASALGYGVRQTLQAARALNADLTIGHQEVGLWVADRLARDGRRTGVDVEDWYSEDLLAQDRIGRPVDVLRRAENAAVRRGGQVTTTSSALAQALAAASGGPAPAVLYNVFPWADRNALDGRRLDRARADGRPSLHWVSQTIGPGRGLETLFAALRDVGTPTDVHLRGDVAADAEVWVRGLFPADAGHHLTLHAVVPPGELLSRIAEHDVGLALEARTPPSRDLTVTNKLFHYLLGGLAVVATETSGQAEVAAAAPDAVRTCPPDDPTALSAALSPLLAAPERLRAARAAALDAARTRFCWERQVPTLLDHVAGALDRPVAATR